MNRRSWFRGVVAGAMLAVTRQYAPLVNFSPPATDFITKTAAELGIPRAEFKRMMFGFAYGMSLSLGGSIERLTGVTIPVAEKSRIASEFARGVVQDSETRR